MSEKEATEELLRKIVHLIENEEMTKEILHFYIGILMERLSSTSEARKTAEDLINWNNKELEDE